MEMIKFFVNLDPELSLLGLVFDIWYFLSKSVIQCDLCQFIASFSVFNILELRMVLALLHVQQYPPNFIDVLKGLWEPRDSNGLTFVHQYSFFL